MVYSSMMEILSRVSNWKFQLILMFCSVLQVILGGGEQVLRSRMNESSACVREDGRDLVWDWMKYQREQHRKYRYVRTKKQLLDEGENPTADYLLGKEIEYGRKLLVVLSLF